MEDKGRARGVTTMVSRKVFAVLGLAVLTALNASAHAAAPATALVNLEIRAQPLRDALNEFGRQSGLQVVFIYTDIDGAITASPLAGRFSPQAALARLLANTELAYEFINPRTVAIRRAGTPSRDEAAPSRSSRALEDSTGSSQLRLAQDDAARSVTQRAGQSATRAGRGESDVGRFVLEEVIVTAQKRKEVLREIPQSVTVVSAATLERQQAHDLQDYVGLVPGMSLQSNARGNTRLTLRGINAGGVASTVAVYVDDVPYGSSSGLADAFFLSGDFDTMDIDRLEVLRGPQGTLYGASALGGVLKFVTTVPQTDELTASISASAETVSGGDLGYSGTGTLNVPLGERAAVRASGFYRRYGGFVDSVSGPIVGLNGEPAILDARRRDDINDVDIYGGRISGLFGLNDAVSLRVTALLQNIASAGSNVIETDPNTLEPLNDRLTFSQYHPETSDIRYRIYSAALDWDLGFASLVSASSYATLDNEFVTDFSFQFAPALTAIFGNPATRPLGAVRHQQTKTDKVTEELRLNSPDNDAFEWLVGAFFTREKSQIGRQAIRATEGITNVVATDIPLLSDALLPTTYREYAGFANATWHLAPRFDLSFGGRWSRNEQEADLTITGLINGPGQVIPDLNSAANVFRYSVAPRFEFNDTASLYARVATGYRAGGPNIVPPAAPPDTPRTYDADETTNYELGFKADWLDHALSVDIAAYYIDWKDIQLFASVNGTGVNTNGGTAVSRGVEFAARAQPLRGLTLMLDGAYADAYLTQDTPALTGGLDGDPLPYVPDWSLNLSGDYEWAVLGSARAYIGSSIRYVGEQTADFAVRTAANSLRRISSYQLIDVRAGLRTTRWSLDAYAKNVSDEATITSIQLAPVGFLPNGAIGTGINRPRTVGVSLSVRF